MREIIFVIILFTIAMSGCTTMSSAIKNGKEDNIIKLIKKGEDVNGVYKEKYGRLKPYLHLAIDHGNIRAVDLLLGAGASTDSIYILHDPNYGTISTTPLVYAILRGFNYSPAKTIYSHEVIKIFLRHGVDVNKMDGYHYTPLMYAARELDVKSVKLLLEHGAISDSRVLDMAEKGYKESAAHYKKMIKRTEDEPAGWQVQRNNSRGVVMTRSQTPAQKRRSISQWKRFIKMDEDEYIKIKELIIKRMK